VGYQNATLWVPNIGPITSPREGFGGKSPLFEFILSTSPTAASGLGSDTEPETDGLGVAMKGGDSQRVGDS